MPNVQIDRVAEIIAEVAVAEIMPRFRNLAPGDVETKAANDFVTVADKSAEVALTQRLKDLLPGSVVLGEEAFAKDQSILNLLDSDDYLWVIDPIDGTSLFKDGQSGFGVMVALMRRGERLAGWIHDPLSKDTIMGEQGAGVRLRDGTALRLAFDATAHSVLPAMIGWKIKGWLDDFPGLVSGVDLPFTFAPGRCSASAYPLLFTGARRFANSASGTAAVFFLRMTHIWDHAPGVFLVEEAGGFSMTWSGAPYDGKNSLSGLIVAPSREVAENFKRFAKPLIDKHFNTISIS
ncbi:MAG: inositol monophosphatase family protein [Bdellovibrionales bacterium]